MDSDDFEQIVCQHYEPLYRFALSLTHAEADACDLTQQTFYIWATKGHQLRDRSKIKSWLFTTRSEEHTSELQSRPHLVCRLLLEKKKKHTATKLVRRSHTTS